MYLTARPSDGVKLQSNLGHGNRDYLSFICVNAYHFTYDVTYPLLVSITDPDAFKGDGYTFRFSFPVIIDHNEGKRDSI